MATATASVTASLSANGNSTASGTMTWTVPNTPSDAVISSVRISGSYSWGGRGNISYVNINGTNCSPDTSFDVALSNSVTPPITVTCRGNNKNATGNHFTWSSLIVTYTYSSASGQKLMFKQNGTWVEVSKAYIKQNGSWVEQSDFENVFHSGTKYIRG